MHSSTILLAGLAATGMAMPTAPAKRAGSHQTVGYWGSASGKNLREYCSDDAGYDIVVLSFLNTFGSGRAPSGGFSEPDDDGYCTINSDGSGNCPALGSDIKACQAAGKTVIMSLGGYNSDGSPNSQGDAEGVAYTLWNSYGNPAFRDDNSPAARPFGDAFVNGFDMDIEHPANKENFKYLVSKLREYFQRDTGNTYYITGAPQCHLPEDNMGDMIQNSQFDKLFTQYYNNPDCNASNFFGAVTDGGKFNFDAWVDYIKDGASKDAELYVGLPASYTAADVETKSWVEPTQIPQLYDSVKDNAKFAGFMWWEAAESDKYNGNGCTFAQEVKSILTTGSTC